jgi:hypothetical protein
VDFFFKQWGGWGPDGKKRSKKHNGRMLEGRIWDAAPSPAIELHRRRLRKRPRDHVISIEARNL